MVELGRVSRGQSNVPIPALPVADFVVIHEQAFHAAKGECGIFYLQLWYQSLLRAKKSNIPDIFFGGFFAHSLQTDACAIVVYVDLTMDHG